MASVASESKSKSKKNDVLTSFKSEENGVLSFTLENVNVSIANAIRRTILSDIPTLVVHCFPHNENQATFHKNTSRLNNEILKQRLSAIPIHIKDHDLPYSELVIEINVKNQSENTINVTTEDFKIKNLTTGKYLQDSAVRKIFPPCPITGDYIQFARLRPEVSTVSPGEELNITAKMSLHTASEDGSYNVASTCAYKFSPDKIRQDEAWQSKLLEISEEEKKDADVIGLLQQNWYNHEGLRYFRKNSFDFKVETIGVFDNNELVTKACDILKSKLMSFSEMAMNDLSVEKSLNTLQHSVDITLPNTGYTIGKIIEYMLHNNYYVGEKAKLFSYVGFSKPHPHDDDSIIRVAFVEKPNNEDATIEVVTKGLVKVACDEAIQIVEEIRKDFA